MATLLLFFYPRSSLQLHSLAQMVVVDCGVNQGTFQRSSCNVIMQSCIQDLLIPFHGPMKWQFNCTIQNHIMANSNFNSILSAFIFKWECCMGPWLLVSCSSPVPLSLMCIVWWYWTYCLLPTRVEASSPAQSIMDHTIASHSSGQPSTPEGWYVSDSEVNKRPGIGGCMGLDHG
jgi:hypothetical protein